MNKREEFENLFVFLRESDLIGTRLDLQVNEEFDDYYIEGTTATNKFMIDMGEDNVSISFGREDESYEDRLVNLLDTFFDKDVNLSYKIRNITDTSKCMKVYEWTNNKDRVDKLITSEAVEYPHFITDVKIYKPVAEKTHKK